MLFQQLWQALEACLQPAWTNVEGEYDEFLEVRWSFWQGPSCSPLILLDSYLLRLCLLLEGLPLLQTFLVPDSGFETVMCIPKSCRRV